jgi:ribosomal protein S12 methylthiotransferase
LKIFIHQLGCDKNRIDGEKLAAKLQNVGYEIVDSSDSAELIIVNTCGFINIAKEESINTVLEFAKEQKVAVAGCLAKRYANNLKKDLKEADIILGLCDTVETLETIIKKYPVKNKKGRCSKRRLLSGPKHFTAIKIAEGCNNNCTYCAIPLIRGSHIQRDEKDILSEARELRKLGVKELLIVAQDTTAYGNRRGLPNLLEKLSKLPNSFEWIRLMYCHPLGVTDELIEAIATLPNVVHYIDMPLQHISNSILEKMNRRYTRTEIEKTIDRLRNKIPDIAIRTTFLVGFPGETSANFKELLDFSNKVEFDRMGAFAYSPEEGTVAAKFSNCPSKKTVRSRIEELLYTQNEIIHKHNVNLVGTRQKVIVDEMIDGAYICRTKRDAPDVDCVLIAKNLRTKPGEFCTVKIKEAIGIDLYS